MTRIATLYPALMGSLLLAGCGAFTGERNVAALDAARPTGSPFTQALTREYRQLADFEWKQMYDWPDGDLFARKGLRAAQGTMVLPDEPQSRSLTADAGPQLAEAHQRLLAALDGGARERNPEQAAIAQSRYDCWLEQQEENWQTQDIAKCRDEFNQAMTALAGRPAAAVPTGDAFMVFFDFDRADLTPAGQRVVNDAIAAARSRGTAGIVVSGNTDTSGSPRYNQDLSRRRAEAVRNALVRGGVDARNIQTQALGETSLLVPTPDGVREPSNRRAEIRFRM
ncbi:MAG TPA: OmpA family protein [Azospirillaceae bacterium]|nr:OmpA family protein [Azospirillaceae bacterium]